MHAETDRHTEPACDQADDEELECVRHRDGALALAEHPQHRAIVEMAGREAACCERHGDRRKQCSEERHQVQELLGTVERLPHLGPSAFERVEPRAAQFALLQGRVGEIAERLDRRRIARHCKAVVDATGRLHEPGAGDVGLVQHDPRREAHEAGAAVGLQHDDAGDLQLRITEQHHVADLQAQRFEQRRIDPHVAGRGDVARRFARTIGRDGGLQPATQRIAGLDRLQRDQLAGAALFVAGPRHRGKAVSACSLQPQRFRALDECRWCRVVAGQHRIAAEQLPRIALQSALEPVGKKADGRERGHREQHGDDQQAQFACAQVAPQGSPAKTKRSIHLATIADAAVAISL